MEKLTFRMEKALNYHIYFFGHFYRCTASQNFENANFLRKNIYFRGTEGFFFLYCFHLCKSKKVALNKNHENGFIFVGKKRCIFPFQRVYNLEETNCVFLKEKKKGAGGWGGPQADKVHETLQVSISLLGDWDRCLMTFCLVVIDLVDPSTNTAFMF